MIEGNTKVYTVLGNPVKHSKSPNMHNAALSELKINACYVPIEAKIDEIELKTGKTIQVILCTKDQLKNVIQSSYAIEIMDENEIVSRIFRCS